MIYSPESWTRNSGAVSLFFVLLIWFSSHPAAFGQQSPERIVSPEVSADHRVTIRLRAPKAKKVLVVMDGYRKPLRMTKDLGGVWSVTTDPLVPDFYGYSILKDGLFLSRPEQSHAASESLHFGQQRARSGTSVGTLGNE